MASSSKYTTYLPIWMGRVSLDKNDNEFNHDKEKDHDAYED